MKNKRLVTLALVATTTSLAIAEDQTRATPVTSLPSNHGDWKGV